MTAREFLDRPRMLQLEIDRKRRRISFLRSQAGRMNAVLQEVRVQASPDPARMQSLLAEAADEEREIRLLEGQRQQAVVDTILAISLLPDPRLVRVLEMRYLEEARWDMIADELFCSVDWIYKLHRQALASLPLPPGATEGPGS